MTYELLIAEKPSASLKIAQALADGKIKKHTENKVIYYEIEHNGKTLVVAAAVGHLYGLKAKDKKWIYPIFDFEWIPTYEISKIADFTKKYLDVIKKLSKNANEITICTDFDLEGEVIGLNLIRFAAKREDGRRMKFSTLTRDELREAYKNETNHLIWPQAKAGEVRHSLDWLFGINLSRALTLSIKAAGSFKIMSTGRVQGPTLNLLSKKEKDIRKFMPKPYWLLELKTDKLSAWHKKGEFWNKGEAENLVKKLKDKIPIVKSIQSKTIIQPPPRPFDLTSLQLESYKKLRITPKQTLDLAQTLYTKGIISYPRTSSQKLPISLGYKKILEKIAKQPKYKNFVKLLPLELKPNEGKKSDPAHPAIYPTGEIGKLSEKELKLYDLIVHRFLATFGQNAKRETVTVEIDVDNEIFVTSGTRTIEAGWHKLYGHYAKFEEQEVPELTKNETLKNEGIINHAKETQPPKRYTEASIIKELEKKSLGTKSISGDTLVYVNGMLKSIEELYRLGEKTNEELLVKLPLASFYKLKEKKIAIKKNVLITKRYKCKNENIFSIETPITRLISDATHKCFLIDNNGILYEKNVSTIKPGESLLFTKLNHFGTELITNKWLNSVQRKYKLQEKGETIYYQSGAGFRIYTLPILESSKLFWLLGYIYGDGNVYRRKEYDGYGIGITIDKNEKELIRKIFKTIEDLFGEGAYGITTPSKRNIIRINVPSVISYYLVKKFPSLSSKEIFKIPEEFISDFIKGYMDSDGNIHLRGNKMVLFKGVITKSNNTARIKLTLSRKKHIIWIKQMLNHLGIKTTTLKHKKAKIKDKKYDAYEIKISGKNNIFLYATYVGFEHPTKREILYKGLLNNSKHYEQIKKIINVFLILLKNNNQFTKFEDKVTYILRKYETLGLIERKRISKGYSRKIAVRLRSNVITKICNFILPLFGKEVLPWNYAVRVVNCEIVEYPKEDLYDLIIDKENPTFITLGGQILHNSTRAQIIESLYQRNYIQERSIEVTDLGLKTNETLRKYVPEILDEKLTRKFEIEMEEVREERKQPEEILNEAKEFLTKFSKHFKENEEKIGKELLEAYRETQAQASLIGKCPNCKDGLLNIKKGPYGLFVSCDKYEICGTTFSMPKGTLIRSTKNICGQCNHPKISLIKKGKRPQEICINKECPSKENNIKLDKNKKCPLCNGKLVIRKSIFNSFIGCSKYPACKYVDK